MTEALRREAAALYRAAFGRAVPEEVAHRYAEGHPAALPRVTPEEQAWMNHVVEAGWDLEALEIRARRRAPDHVVCRKFRFLLYVAEAHPDSYADLVGEEPSRVRAFGSLARHAFRSLRKRMKAWLLPRGIP